MLCPQEHVVTAGSGPCYRGRGKGWWQLCASEPSLAPATLGPHLGPPICLFALQSAADGQGLPATPCGCPRVLEGRGPLPRPQGGLRTPGSGCCGRGDSGRRGPSYHRAGCFAPAQLLHGDPREGLGVPAGGTTESPEGEAQVAEGWGGHLGFRMPKDSGAGATAGTCCWLYPSLGDLAKPCPLQVAHPCHRAVHSASLGPREGQRPLGSWVRTQADPHPLVGASAEGRRVCTAVSHPGAAGARAGGADGQPIRGA